jgi:hypothetical protein
MAVREAKKAMKNVGLALVVGIAFIAVAALLQQNMPDAATQLEAAITLSATVIGFFVSIYGGVNAYVALESDVGTLQERAVVAAPSAAVGIAGALLMVASRL